MASAFGFVPFQMLVPVVLVGLVAAVAVAAPALLRGDPRTALLRVSRVLLGGALLAVLAVTLSGGGGRGINLIPGAGIRAELNDVNQDLGLLNLVGNVLMFMPVGFLLPLATRSGFRRALAACVAISVAVEVLQLILARSFDVDDVLLNAFGGGLGAALAVAFATLWRRARVAPPQALLGAGGHKAEVRSWRGQWMFAQLCWHLWAGVSPRRAAHLTPRSRGLGRSR